MPRELTSEETQHVLEEELRDTRCFDPFKPIDEWDDQPEEDIQQRKTAESEEGELKWILVRTRGDFIKK